MNLPRPLFFLARALFAAFVLLTFSYCVLAYVPFTYQQMVVAAPLDWLSLFVKFHPYTYWAALAVLAATVIPDARRPETRLAATAFLGACAALGIFLLVHPVLRALENNDASLYWAFAFLLPLLWLALIDWLAERKRLAWAVPPDGENGRIFRAAWQTAAFVALLYTAIFYLRGGSQAAPGFGLREGIVSLTWTLVAHLHIFMALFAILLVLRAAARLLAPRSRTEFILFTALICLLAASILRRLVFPQISFADGWATAFALAVAISFGLWFAGLSLRLYRAPESTVNSGLTLLLTPLRWMRALPGAAGLAFFVVIALAAYFLAVQSAFLDWNYLRQKLSALFIWTAAFANFYDLAPAKHAKERSRLRVAAPLLIAVAAFAAYPSLVMWQQQRSENTDGGKPPVFSVLANYAGYDASFKLIYDNAAASGSSGSSASAFYKFLNENTNIASETRPVDVGLVDNLAPGNGSKPNIIVVVIDSLRRDYLSVYNRAVTFTPNMEAFARESAVMQNAFARYGGTGLSEPSIWVGGMLLHKQYVTPFYPMNALQRLVDTEGYATYISRDPILDAILKPSPSVTDLECDIPGRRWDFCRTMEDLEGKLASRSDKNRPVFAFAQPQNIHDFEISREGESVPPGESYPGFYEPVAARLRQMDLCWGKFIQFMKRSGLYDKSIIVLTSDHGDLLGETGIFGHGWVLFQKAIEIPLIVHLPPSLQARLSFDPRAVSFLTDITPSLYYLLGHRPVRQNGIFGRPLFTETPEEANQYVRDSYVIASSYGPVYGIVKDNGRSLYIVNASDQKDFLYDLPENASAVAREATAAIRSENERIIREQIEAINRFYGRAQ